MSRKHRRFTSDFKNKAVELSYERGSVIEVAEELDIAPPILYRWRSEAKKYVHNSFPGRGKPKQTDEEKEISRLKAALKDAQLERDILKKAISIFSKSDKKSFDL